MQFVLVNITVVAIWSLLNVEPFSLLTLVLSSVLTSVLAVEAILLVVFVLMRQQLHTAQATLNAIDHIVKDTEKGSP